MIPYGKNWNFQSLPTECGFQGYKWSKDGANGRRDSKGDESKGSTQEDSFIDGEGMWKIL